MHSSQPYSGSHDNLHNRIDSIDENPEQQQPVSDIPPVESNQHILERQHSIVQHCLMLLQKRNGTQLQQDTGTVNIPNHNTIQHKESFEHQTIADIGCPYTRRSLCLLLFQCHGNQPRHHIVHSCRRIQYECISPVSHQYHLLSVDVL